MSVKRMFKVLKERSGSGGTGIEDEEIKRMIDEMGAKSALDYLMREKVPEWQVVFIHQLWKRALGGSAWASRLVLEYFIKPQTENMQVPEIELIVKEWESNDEKKGRD